MFKSKNPNPNPNPNPSSGLAPVDVGSPNLIMPVHAKREEKEGEEGEDDGRADSPSQKMVDSFVHSAIDHIAHAPAAAATGTPLRQQGAKGEDDDYADDFDE